MFKSFNQQYYRNFYFYHALVWSILTVKQFDRGWAKSLVPLIRVRVNISAQWLIGRFVRVLHSKSDLINCAGVGRRTLF
ncbi:hypothetical protein RFL03_00900 [Streptococcus parasuis]|uniref:hypothetical protein n=1 Tax=Streptococcus parasuis TaxID=1501662 RepID=UPI00207D8770|nr:hypothetical protein SUT328_14210 [Streptococcus parasuis]